MNTDTSNLCKIAPCGASSYAAGEIRQAIIGGSKQMASKGFYRNSSGYYDPTAGAAMSQVMKEYKQARREQWQKDTEVKSRPKAYVVSQYAGDKGVWNRRRS